MKKLIIFLFITCLCFTGCDYTHRDEKTGIEFHKPNNNILPDGFELVSDAKNGWYLYKSPVGYFLVSVQGVVGNGSFVDMVFIGRRLEE